MTKKKAVTVNRKLASKILALVDKGLCSGVGVPEPGKMCVEAAVCYAMNLPHGDEPPCVAPAIRALKIKLNDAIWSTNEARAKGMRRLAIAQLGTAGKLDETEFKNRVVIMTINKIIPLALHAAAAVHPKQKHKDALEKHAQKCETVSDAAARVAQDAARVAYAAEGDAEGDAASVAYAAARAARDAAYAADDATGDALLAFFAEEVVKILIDMEAEGAQWLDLTEVANVIKHNNN
jgi:hypothetical protein